MIRRLLTAPPTHTVTGSLAGDCALGAVLWAGFFAALIWGIPS